jgi:long-chain acyl-CoA synthetase
MIFEQFRDAAQQHRDELAIIDGDQRITYGQLLELIGGMRAWLQSTLNPKAGDVVAVSLSNTWQFVACFFAVSELGGVFMPCNPQWRAGELRRFAGRLGFRGAITDPQFRKTWDQAGDVLNPESVLTVPDAVNGCAPGAAPVTRSGSEDAPALYLATSGSMGVPRVASRSHRNLAAAARNTARTLGIGHERRFLSVVPFFHVSGFSNSMLMPLLHGATVVLMRRFTAAACADLIYRERVDVLIGSPVIFGFLADSVEDPGLLASLQLCFSAGARLPAALSQHWRNRFGVRVRQWYGMSETGTISIDLSPGEAPSRAGAFVGAPISGVEVRVIGPEGREAGPGTAGEVTVRSEAVMAGYAGQPESNQHIFVDGFFKTGDLGYVDTEGNLYLTGRIRPVINTGGVKVDPVEIEETIEALPHVSACRVDAVAEGRAGDVIRARVVIRQGQRITRRDVIEQCRLRLAEYKLPRIVEFVETLPATMAGKIPAEWSSDESGR